MIKSDKNNYPRAVDNLTYFSIDLYSGHKEDSVYANENMQVGIFITIIAVDAHQEQVLLPDSLLDDIELIKYIDSEKLPEGWSYSSTENDYSHTFPLANSDSKKEDTFDLPHKKIEYNQSDEKTPKYQRKLYWIKTKNTETIRISAKIKIDGKTYSTNDKSTIYASNNSNPFITIVAYPPVIYHSENLTIIKNTDVNFGQYLVEKIGQGTIEQHFKWAQNNYFIVPKPEIDHFVIKDITVSGTYNDSDTKDPSYRSFTYHVKTEDLYFWFLWGQEKAVREAGSGVTVNKDIGDFTYKATPKINIITTPRIDAVCLSRLYFESPTSDFWDDKPNNSPLFKFTDIYGNKSYQIVIEMKDYSEFIMKDWQPQP